MRLEWRNELLFLGFDGKRTRNGFCVILLREMDGDGDFGFVSSGI